MKILAISDVENENILNGRDSFDDADVIISCGDLGKDYLESASKAYGKTLLYVKGNHDSYRTVPSGCSCINAKIVNIHGMKILGISSVTAFGNILTEKQMNCVVKRLKRKIIASGGIDILVTHHPAKGIGDLDDLYHRGYGAFKDLLDEFSPKLMLYGHVHLNYDYKLKRKFMYKDTCMVNAYDKYSVEV